MYQPRVRRPGDEIPGVGRVERKRLFTDHMFARIERPAHLFGVSMVRRRDVHDMDVGVRQHRFIRFVHVGQVRGLGLDASPFRRRTDYTHNVDADPAERLDMGDTDEPDTHHAHPNFWEPHRHFVRPFS